MFRLLENQDDDSQSPSVLSNLGLLLLLAAATVLSSSLAYAAGGGEGHTPTFSDTLPYWGNFIVFVAIFFWLIRPPFLKFWEHRRADLESSVTAGERELKAAMEELESAKSLLAGVSDEIESMKSSIHSETEREHEKILAEAKARAERIAAQAGDSIEAEKKAAEVEIRKELAERVVEQARSRLKSEVDASFDEKLRQSGFRGITNLVQ